MNTKHRGVVALGDDRGLGMLAISQSRYYARPRKQARTIHGLRCRSASILLSSTYSNRFNGGDLTLRRALPLNEGMNPPIGSRNSGLLTIGRNCGHDPPQCRAPDAAHSGECHLVRACHHGWQNWAERDSVLSIISGAGTLSTLEKQYPLHQA